MALQFSGSLFVFWCRIRCKWAACGFFSLFFYSLALAKHIVYTSYLSVLSGVSCARAHPFISHLAFYIYWRLVVSLLLLYIFFFFCPRESGACLDGRGKKRRCATSRPTSIVCTRIESKINESISTTWIKKEIDIYFSFYTYPVQCMLCHNFYCCINPNNSVYCLFL